MVEALETHDFEPARRPAMTTTVKIVAILTARPGKAEALRARNRATSRRCNVPFVWRT